MRDLVGKRILVTGATGIVGSWLCAELLRAGNQVIALVRDQDPQTMFFRENVGGACSIVAGELESLRACVRAVNEYEAQVVFHLGAQTIVGNATRDPLGTFEANIRGTYNLLEACRQVGSAIEAIVIASSDKAYGSSPILPYLETMPLRGDHPYDVSKSCADLLANCYCVAYGLPVAIARCGNIYGGADLNWSRIVPGTIRSLLRGEAPIIRSSGSNIRDYVYVLDVVNAYILLAENMDNDSVRGGAFNFSPSVGKTVLEVVSAISEIMGSTLQPIVLDSANGEIQDQVLSAEKAKNVLGWSPRWDLKAGLAETVDWYRTFLSRSPGADVATV